MSAEFLVEFAVDVPEGTPTAEVEKRERAEATAAAKLAADGRLVRLWRLSGAEVPTAIGLYRADSRAQLDALLAALPLAAWMGITVTPLAPHPNDPGSVTP